MNYYIQGDAAKAKQIKATFEAKAIYHNLTFANENYLYYSCDGKVDFCFIGGGLANIIKTHPDYKELKLPVEPKFKVGDWIIRNNRISYVPIQIYGLKKDRYLVTNMLGSKGELMINRQDEWHLWTIQDAKDGDVLVNGGFIFIFKNIDDGNGVHYYCAYEIRSHEEYEQFHIACFNSLMGRVGNSYTHYTPATKEQSALLFQKMKEAGYEWDADKKELRKIIEPKFRVGDDIKTGNTIETIAEVGHATRSYYCESGRTIWFENQDLWHLAPKPHYDIKNFKPFDKVLVRDSDDRKWRCNWFSHYSGEGGVYRFVTTKCGYAQCIPFNDITKHLLGTTDMCSEEYINW